MKAAVLNIGDEVLAGTTINKDLSIIAKSALKKGILIDKQITVRDDKKSIIENFDQLFENYDMVFVSGGLGPTADDLTTESIAEALKREMHLDDDVLSGLKEYFVKRGRKMYPNNKKQAYFPDGSIKIHNDYGTAEGYYIMENNKWIVVMPGPPIELKNILDKFLDIYGSNQGIINTSINTFGVGESEVESKLREIDFPEDISVNTYFTESGVDIRLKTDVRNKEAFENAVNIIFEKFNDIIYATDSKSLSNTLLEYLLKNDKKVAFAESCTGGNIASDFTKNPGASSALICSLVTYTEEAKEKELGVKRETLDEYSAVSRQTATEMISGLRKKYDADYYAVTTGYASPTGDEDKDGLVFIGLYDKINDKLIISENHYKGVREKIIKTATNDVYFGIIKMMKTEGLNGCY